MSDGPRGFQVMSDALKDRTDDQDDDESSDEPTNLGSNEEVSESSADEPTNLGSNEDEGTEEPTETATSDDERTESFPQNRPSSTDTSSRSSGRRVSSRSRRGDHRSASSSSRKSKVFMFGPEEERQFNILLADVRSRVRQKYPEASVQNSQLVRAMVEMTIEDLEEGEDLILDYVMDQIEKDRQSS